MKFLIDSYKLEYIEDEDKYYISFKDSVKNDCKIEIKKEVFDTYLISKKKYIKQKNESSRHFEQAERTEEEIYNLTFNKPRSLEEQVIRKIDIEKLNEAKKELTEKQLKRIEANIINGISIRELARIEGVRKTKIEKSIYVGLKKIKIFFNKRGGQTPD